MAAVSSMRPWSGREARSLSAGVGQRMLLLTAAGEISKEVPVNWQSVAAADAGKT